MRYAYEWLLKEIGGAVLWMERFLSIVASQASRKWRVLVIGELGVMAAVEFTDNPRAGRMGEVRFERP